MIDPDTIDRLPLFRGAGAAARREAALRGVRVRFAPGQVLWTAGAQPRGLFLVLEGRVRVVRAVSGRQHVVHEEGPGGTLGDVPLFAGGAYPATAVAAGPAECVRLDRDAIEAIIAAEPRFALALLERMAIRVRGLIERLDRLAAHTVPSRLAGHLLERWEAAGRGEFVLGATQAEVAEELGTVREVVVRELHRLRRAGVLRAAGRARFRVLDEPALRARAAGAAGASP